MQRAAEDNGVDLPDIDVTHGRLVASGVDVSEVRTGRKQGTRVMTVRNSTCGVPTLLVQPSARKG